MQSLFPAALLALLPAADAAKLPASRPVGKLEVVATFDGPMPTGVTVSQRGRIFVNFPRWGDPVTFTVAEVKDGKPVAFPEELNKYDPNKAADCLVSVQSVVVGPKDRLWILDTGSVEFGPVKPGGGKLVGVDLASNKVFKKIVFPPDVALPTSYLNDVRFHLGIGKEGTAFITDSSLKGANAIIVVDLASGKSWRRLNDHPSTRPDENFQATAEGRILMNRPPDGPATPMHFGSDGIAISADGKRLYYCPLSSRRLYSVSVPELADPNQSDEAVAKTVTKLEDRGFASDGLESDDKGRLYLTDYEHNAIHRRSPDGKYETLVFDPRVLWPDTLSVAADGHLYFTANQLHRQKQFHHGKDLREKPYVLFRVKIDAGPVLLK